ncbi:EVE domain-containing protein [Mariluticola halotolerans]|uniref:EVE domain-containing protein n=1 Tax=Mariluticola halotolerans TaxID=2909283 RepID=UPI0026E1BB69|nr:EVE domain-containing protein [Mariluticola halotolerans]UJQ93637.1 EVE domain-containing protein [Mariluticola halotolerans]
MAYWLFKSEPSTWGWDDQVKKGAPEEWDGVRNYAARNFMRQMQIGDLGFFYHSVDEKRIVGIVRVAATAHVDSTADNPTWECVDIEAVKPMPKPVSLAEIKENPALEDMALVKLSRLSVQPVTGKEWEIVCAMGGL